MTLRFSRPHAKLTALAIAVAATLPRSRTSTQQVTPRADDNPDHSQDMTDAHLDVAEGKQVVLLRQRVPRQCRVWPVQSHQQRRGHPVWISTCSIALAGISLDLTAASISSFRQKKHDNTDLLCGCHLSISLGRERGSARP